MIAHLFVQAKNDEKGNLKGSSEEKVLDTVEVTWNDVYVILLLNKVLIYVNFSDIIVRVVI